MRDHEPNTTRISKDLQPTATQLEQLRDLIFFHEPEVGPFDGYPSKEILDEHHASLNDFELMTATPSYDETLAPSSILRAPDKRVLWLSTFRNPDTNQWISQHITIIDPPINRSSRPEIPQEAYRIVELDLGRIAIEHMGGSYGNRTRSEGLTGTYYPFGTDRSISGSQQLTVAISYF
ncbi:MAG: hypothetical protein ACQR33_02075 [Candidatus Saccharibacteria bacterium]